MRRRGILAAAYLFDWLAGDPEWFPHPVRLIGKCVDLGERALRREDQTDAMDLLAGGALTFALVATTYVGTAKAIEWAHNRNHRLGFLVEALFAWTCLASRNLDDQASSVVAALEAGDISLARHDLARIVGRDTGDLDYNEISRAVIETVAESCSDGVIAPLFYMALGGAPLAMTYKAVNTLDSMIGHTDERYFYFGKAAARLDDVANLLPSRMTALAIIAGASAVEGADSTTAWDLWRRDRNRHKSPNAGQPESAMAGALRVRLGGRSTYQGEVVMAPVIGDKFARPSAQSARKAIQIAAVTSIVGAVAAFLLVGKNR
jgi:adenosylcobinamide-phosphate synthase